MPEGAPTCTLWTEPAVWDADFGSSALSNAEIKSVFIPDTRFGFPVESHLDTSNATVTAGKEKARPATCRPAGTWEEAGRSGSSEAFSLSAKRVCGAVAVGGARQ